MPLIPDIDDVKTLVARLRRTVDFVKHSPHETVVVFLGLLASASGTWVWRAESSPLPVLVDEATWQSLGWQLGLAFFAAGLACFAWVIWRFWRRLSPPTEEPAKVLPSAIKGPLAFGPADGDIFLRLGRQAEIGELLSHILDDQAGLVVVCGESGAGKTSLLRAGLSRALEDQYPPIVYHYWEAVPDKPVEGLLAAIRAGWTATPEAPQPEKLADLEKPDSLSGRRVVVLDQFEQLARSRKPHQPIFRLLKHVLTETRPPHRTTWIVAYRRAYDAEWRDFEQEELAGHEHKERMLNVRLFHEDRARDAMAVISDAAGFQLEMPLVAELLAGMRNEDGLISPVDIAITLLVLNERAQSRPDKTVRRADLALTGGATGLLAGYYIERQLDRYTPDERTAIYAMLLELADLASDRRLPEGLDTARLAAAVGRPPGVMEPHLRWLAAANVRLLEALPTGNWRLPHERLIPALRQLSGRLLADTDRARRLLDRSCAAWITDGKKRSRLLRGADLRDVLRHGPKLAIGTDEADKVAYIEASTRARNVRRGLAAAALLLAVAGGYGGWSGWTARDWTEKFQNGIGRRNSRDGTCLPLFTTDSTTWCRWSSAMRASTIWAGFTPTSKA